MSKKLPAWIVLTVISLVAALALGATYNGTKDRIATQEAEKAVAVRQELLPAAADFKLLTAEDETEVYQGLDASGASVGYVSVGTVTGFGGPVEVTVGMDDEGTIAGVRVGGSNFSETAGLGAKSKEPAFYEQFAGMVYPVDLTKNGGEVDAITAATITSSAVVRGVNDTAKYIAEKAGIKLKEPVVLVQELGNNRYATSKQGFGGPVYVEAEIVDGAITDIVIGDANFNETSGYGAGAKEEKFYSQYVGKSGTGLVLNSDVDQVSGATITSTAVNDAVNLLLLYVNDRAAYEAQLADAPEEVDVSIPAGAQTWTAKGKGLTGTFDVTIAVDENAAVTGIEVGDASTAEDGAFLGQVKNNNAFLAQFIGTAGNINAASIDTVTGATISSNGVISAVNKAWNESQGIVEATPAPTAEPTGAEYKTKGQGLTGAFSVWVYVDNGAVTGLKVRSTESEYDEPYLDLVKGNSAFLSQFVGKSGQIAESDIDLVSGATISSQGVLAAVNDALAKAASAPAEATPAPAAEVAGTEYKTKGQGLTGAFNVTVVLDDNGAVAGVKIGSSESEYDGTYLDMVKGSEAFLSQFVGKTGEIADADTVTGATISSKSVVDAVNEVLKNAAPAAAPAAEPAAEVTGTEYKTKGQGLTGAFGVTVVLDDTGAVAGVKIGSSESEYDGTYLDMVKGSEAFLSQFVGKTGEIADADTVTGATISSKSVVDAVNEVLKNNAPAAAPAAEPAAEAAGLAGEYAVSVQGFTDPMDVQVTLDDNGAVIQVAVEQSQSATDGAYVEKVRTSEAFLNQFIGKAAPIADGEIDVVTGATFASKAVVAAVNDVFAQKGITAAPAAEEPQQSEAGASSILADGAYTLTGKGMVDDVNVTVTVENGKIAKVEVAESASATDALYVDMVRKSEGFLGQFIGKDALLAETDIDVVTGATITSRAVHGIVNQVIAGDVSSEAEAQLAEEPAAQPAEEGDVWGGVAYMNGLTGTFGVAVDMNADGTVKNVSLTKSDSDMDAEYLAKITEEWLGQFVGKTLPVAGIDTVAGATISSSAVIEAVNGFAQAPAEEPAAEAPATLAGEYTQEAQSFLDALKVTVTLDDAGAITAINVADSENADSAPYAAKAQSEAFLSQFIGKKAPLAEDDADVVTGATFSCKAVISAVNAVYEQLGVQAEPAAPAEKETKEAVTYKDGNYQAAVDALTVTVTVADGKVADVAVQADAAAEDALYVAMVAENAAFLSQFAGQSAPVEADAVTGATFTSDAVAQAVNQALESAK